MASYHRQNSQVNKKKISISYVIRDKEEKCHRAGINALQYDTNLERLYTAGRDSVIRTWNFPEERCNEKYETTNHHESSNECCFVESLEHHTDWVNDIALCCNGRDLISVSNDNTIKVWDAHQGFCLSTLRSHKDYAKCLAYAKDKEIVASAGFDRLIYLWDIRALTMLTATKNTVTTKPLDGSKCSIYSLAISQSGNIVASGSTEKLIRLWDPRTRQKLLKLRGHTDNVRSLVFSQDGSMLLSGSSDGTVRLWSISQQRCVSIIRVHDEGVWTLQADESFNKVYSGGRDCKVFKTDLRNTSDSALLCEERAPIIRILLVDRLFSNNGVTVKPGQSLWVATADSSFRNWAVETKYKFDGRNVALQDEDRTRDTIKKPSQSVPSITIDGNPAVIKYHILNDKRHILALRTDGSIGFYDVLSASMIEIIKPPLSGESNDAKQRFEEEKARVESSRMVFVPNWFSVDLKTGLLCIHLDESECLTAWVSAREYGFMPNIEGQDPKVNLGCLTLQALFEYWPPTFDTSDKDSKFQRTDAQSNRMQSEDYSLVDNTHKPIGNTYFSIEPHTPIIISEGSQTLLRFLARDAGNDIDKLIIQELLPHWVCDIIVARYQPKFNKVPFFLLPHANSGIKSLRKERLSASDMLQMRKVIEHVCEKMIVMDEAGSTSGNSEQSTNFRGSAIQQKTFPIEKVDLFCNDQKLDVNLDLRTVKHYIWKTGGDLVLHYMPHNT